MSTYISPGVYTVEQDLSAYISDLSSTIVGMVGTADSGPTNTPMTAAMKGNENFASPEDVAKTIVSGIESKKAVIYAPAKWKFIMMVIQHLPSFIFNKMNI